jgi:hypothetical protein
MIRYDFGGLLWQDGTLILYDLGRIWPWPLISHL